MKGLFAWIVFGLTALICLFWIGFGVRDDLREDDVFHDVIQERIEIAESSGETVLIGVVGDWEHHGGILQGVKWAAEDINKDGGILGRKVILDSKDDQGTASGALATSQLFVSNPEVAFVIGHTRRSLSALVAQNYMFYGLLSISPNTAGNRSSRNSFSLLFENGMPPRQISGAILNLAKENGWSRLGLIYANSDYAMRQAHRFESMANKHEVRIPLSFGYKGRGSGIAQHMEHWKREFNLDAMVLAVDDADIVPLISAFRVIGIDCPFIVVSELPVELKSIVPENLGTLYFIDSIAKTPAYAKLRNRIQAKPDYSFSIDNLQGYDALSILAQAIENADSFVPSRVAEKLVSAKIENSVSGTLRFDEHGSAVKRPPTFKKY